MLLYKLYNNSANNKLKYREWMTEQTCKQTIKNIKIQQLHQKKLSF